MTWEELAAEIDAAGRRQLDRAGDGFAASSDATDAGQKRLAARLAAVLPDWQTGRYAIGGRTLTTDDWGHPILVGSSTVTHLTGRIPE